MLLKTLEGYILSVKGMAEGQLTIGELLCTWKNWMEIREQVYRYVQRDCHDEIPYFAQLDVT